MVAKINPEHFLGLELSRSIYPTVHHLSKFNKLFRIIFLGGILVYENHDPDLLDDGLGDDLIDRGSSKAMGSTGGGGGSYIDPAYEEALRITDSAFGMPAPYEQRALYMEDAHAAKLARLMTELRSVSRADDIKTNTAQPGVGSDAVSTAQAVEKFFVALQENPIDSSALNALREKIPVENDKVRLALDAVCDFPDVEAKLEG